MEEITDQASLDRVLKSVDWSEKLVKEAHIASPQHLCRGEDGQVWETSGHGGFLARLVILFPFGSVPGLEFVFWQVIGFSLGSLEFDPEGEISHSNVTVYFSRGPDASFVIGRRLWVQQLTEAAWSPDSMYGRGSLFDDAGFPRGLMLRERN